MKFAMFSDLHYDVIPDGDNRIEDFLNHVKKAEAEFIVELGDLCYPIHENYHILDKLRSDDLAVYFTIGNHNTDSYTTDKVIKFFNLERSYYSFTKENIKFIVLDACFIKKKNNVIQYCKQNYDKSKDEYTYIPDEEKEWLKKELEDKEKYFIIISHQSLANDFEKRGICNREEIRTILEKSRRNGSKILFCINGHDHGGDCKVINEIYYYTLNSCSYIWHGARDVFSYSKEVHQQYPYLKDIILYNEALHVIVDIDENMNVHIQGVDGHYQKHSPNDIGLGNTWNGVSIEAKTPTVFIKCNYS